MVWYTYYFSIYFLKTVLFWVNLLILLSTFSFCYALFCNTHATIQSFSIFNELVGYFLKLFLVTLKSFSPFYSPMTPPHKCVLFFSFCSNFNGTQGFTYLRQWVSYNCNSSIFRLSVGKTSTAYSCTTQLDIIFIPNFLKSLTWDVCFSFLYIFSEQTFLNLWNLNLMIVSFIKNILNKNCTVY